jgi:hypothetical protein
VLVTFTCNANTSLAGTLYAEIEASVTVYIASLPTVSVALPVLSVATLDPLCVYTRRAALTVAETPVAESHTYSVGAPPTLSEPASGDESHQVALIVVPLRVLAAPNSVVVFIMYPPVLIEPTVYVDGAESRLSVDAYPDAPEARREATASMEPTARSRRSTQGNNLRGLTASHR